jgi:hypothetical protein
MIQLTNFLASLALAFGFYQLFAYRWVEFGWLAPTVSLVMWVAAFALFCNGFIAHWLFWVLAVLGTTGIAGVIGARFLFIWLGRQKYAAWCAILEVEDAFKRVTRACRSAENRDAANRVWEEAHISLVHFRAGKPFYRKSLRPTDAECRTADERGLELLGSFTERDKVLEKVRAQAYKDAGRRVTSPLVRYQKLLEETRCAFYV